jgi:hypothetical protein
MKAMTGFDDYTVIAHEGRPLILHDHQKDVDGDFTENDVRVALRDHCPRTRHAFNMAGGIPVHECALGFLVQTPIRLEDAALFAIELETTFSRLHLPCQVKMEQMSELVITFSVAGREGHVITVSRLTRLLRVGAVDEIGDIPVSSFVFNQQGEDLVLLHIETKAFARDS